MLKYPSLPSNTTHIGASVFSWKQSYSFHGHAICKRVETVYKKYAVNLGFMASYPYKRPELVYISRLRIINNCANTKMTKSRIGTYVVGKNNRQGISWLYTEYKLNVYYCYVNRYLQFSCHVFTRLFTSNTHWVLSRFCLCIKRVRLNWNFIVYDIQNATYSGHGAPCPARDLFPWL